MNFSISPLSNKPGLRLADTTQESFLNIYTDTEVATREIPNPEFVFSIGCAVAFEAKEIAIPRKSLNIFTGDGTFHKQCISGEIKDGTYYYSPTSAPFKVLIRIEGQVDISAVNGETILTFPETTTVELGLRTLSEKPVGEIKTPLTPEGIAQAISLFGAGLRTTSPERSYPTLRGHPPTITEGDSFSYSDDITPPETGLTIVVPFEYGALYTVAPLAYYLGADLRAGDNPRIEGSDWNHSLGPNLHKRTREALYQTFALDCIVRSAGLYPLDYRLEDNLPFSLDKQVLYDLTLEVRTKEYLDFPFADIEPHLPEWHNTVDIVGDSENALALPYTIADLSTVRGISCPNLGSGTQRKDQLFSLDPVQTSNHTYIGDGIPIGATKGTVESYQRGLDWEADDINEITVTTVCNNDAMAAETNTSISDIRNLVRFDMNIHRNLTKEQLVEVLESHNHFLHYIGHASSEGLECSDGHLDLTDIDIDVRAKTFLLNACSSYEQGEAIVDAGSLGGIATLADINDEPATAIGKTIAQLLNTGFSLKTALKIAKEDSITGHEYAILGDGAVEICQSRSGPITASKISAGDSDDTYDLTAERYPSNTFQVGSHTKFHYSMGDHVYVPSNTTLKNVPIDDINQITDKEHFPLFINGELHWSDEDIRSLVKSIGGSSQ